VCAAGADHWPEVPPDARGVDAELFHPAKRKRNPEDHAFVLGFVGRLSVEKNVALLAQVQQGWSGWD